jgi:hypothetical protein
MNGSGETNQRRAVKDQSLNTLVRTALGTAICSFQIGVEACDQTQLFRIGACALVRLDSPNHPRISAGGQFLRKSVFEGRSEPLRPVSSLSGPTFLCSARLGPELCGELFHRSFQLSHFSVDLCLELL